MFELHERIDQKRIAKCLRRDPLFAKTLGVKNTHKTLKTGGILLAVWALIMFVTPLPEYLLMNRIGLIVILLAAAVCWAADIGYHIANIDEAAKNLESILKKEPKLKIITEGEKNTIVHERFTAECSAMTQLELKAMLEVETELRDAINSALDRPVRRERKPETPRERA